MKITSKPKPNKVINFYIPRPTRRDIDWKPFMFFGNDKNDLVATFTINDFAKYECISRSSVISTMKKLYRKGCSNEKN